MFELSHFLLQLISFLSNRLSHFLKSSVFLFQIFDVSFLFLHEVINIFEKCLMFFFLSFDSVLVLLFNSLEIDRFLMFGSRLRNLQLLVFLFKMINLVDQLLSLRFEVRYFFIFSFYFHYILLIQRKEINLLINNWPVLNLHSSLSKIQRGNSLLYIILTWPNRHNHTSLGIST